MEMDIRKKEFTYKGLTIEELKKLDVREFAKFLNSRQRRTILRNFQEVENFINRSKEKIKKNKKVKTHQRDLVIVPQMIGMKIGVYNGNNFITTEITGEMLGHKFGEFAPTRTRVKHSKSGVGSTKGSKHKSKK
ncbi:MAG: 30S ribosomal protein S19 [Nanoarchaeota archaeon]|nr:30S ribosomal protein S19 [Nanoarchaeota archaeon]MBU4117050.1 30S ribosomal protein S19 [Nanoarchaeota archaeon]